MAKNILAKTNLSLGIQIEFYHQWSKWSERSTASENITTDIAYPNTSKKPFSNLNLATILNSNPYGQSVIQAYEKESSLNEHTRKILCESIIHYCIDRGHSLTIKDTENLVKEIVFTFKGEDMVSLYRL